MTRVHFREAGHSIGVTAAILGVSPAQVAQLAADGKLRTWTTDGGQRRYDADDVARLSTDAGEENGR